LDGLPADVDFEEIVRRQAACDAAQGGLVVVKECHEQTEVRPGWVDDMENGIPLLSEVKDSNEVSASPGGLLRRSSELRAEKKD
jgi:hypothetical protein